MAFELASRRTFSGLSVFVLVTWVTSAALTVGWCSSMSEMGGMPMPGGWTMSMTWMRMPGQSWPGAAASFLGMWLVMMVAMMLPSLGPMLVRYQRAVAATAEGRVALLTCVVGLGYFFVWLLFGLAAFPLGAALAQIEMRAAAIARAVPIAVGVVVLIVGALQFTAWKARYLACCRGEHNHSQPPEPAVGAAWRNGLRLGVECCYCCGSLMVLLLVGGVMDIGAMSVVTLAVTIERLAPDGERVARGIGLAVVGVGLLLIARAAGPG
jgi:predicted metal-binding membrane protein